MNHLSVSGASIAAVRTRLGGMEVDNLETARLVAPDRAEALVKTSGILKRRVAAKGETSLSLCVAAARELMASVAVAPGEIGAVVSVSFTPQMAMPGNAHLAQAALGLAPDVAAFDLAHACAGFIHGLYLAARFAADSGKCVLLLDGDAQTPLADASTAMLLSDAGSATLVRPDPHGKIDFAFLADGSRADALKVEGGKLRMDGFGVFKFVADDVRRFLEEFVSRTGDVAAFVPHQANVYMVKSLAKSLGLEGRVVITGDMAGNCASASVALGLEKTFASNLHGGVLLAGFGGGLAAAAARIEL